MKQKIIPSSLIALPLLFLFSCHTASVDASEAENGSLECSLNGIYDTATSSCACDAPWKGTRCDQFDILPQKRGYKAAYGWQPNVTSWGGNIIYDERDGLYHLFVSVMAGGCGLSQWSKVSYIVHAVAEDPMQPFQYKDTALDVFAHNAAPVRAPPSHSPCPGCYYLFHIGSGRRAGNEPLTCDPSSWDDTAPSKLERELHSSNFQANNVVAHWSKSPSGPWIPMTGPGCNNPAPAFDLDGTLYVVCQTQLIYKAMNTSSSPGTFRWIRKGEIPLNKWTLPQDKPYVFREDGYLYTDHRGNWHFLTHTYDYRDSSLQKHLGDDSPYVSSHAFSRDLSTWFLSQSQPFRAEIVHDDGTTKKLGKLGNVVYVHTLSGLYL